MKRIAAIALLAASTFITAGSVLAQDSPVKATIPFNFTVGSSTLPAGSYTISSRTASGDVLALSNWQKNVNVLTMGMPNQNPERSNVLVFHKYETKDGAKYFLSEIRSGGALNVRFTATKAEKRAKAQIEEAGLFVSDPILLALN